MPLEQSLVLLRDYHIFSTAPKTFDVVIYLILKTTLWEQYTRICIYIWESCEKEKLTASN